MTGMLAPYRVLDLTTGQAELATFMLAGFGADVIKVEPADGTPREPGELADLYRATYNRGKRSVALDFDDESGRADFSPR